MENAFHPIEQEAPRIIKKINFPGTGKKVAITEKERETLSFFAAIQLVRVPNFRDGIQEMHRRLAEITLNQIVKHDREQGTLPKEVEALFEEGQIKIDIDPASSLKPMIDMARTLSSSLLKKTWHFAAPADGMALVTSDNPVYWQTPEQHREEAGSNLGPAHPLTEITLPLRQDLLLVFSPSAVRTPDQIRLLDYTSVQLDETDTDNINKRTTLSAARYIYSSQRSDALAEMVGKFKGTSQRTVV